LIVDEDNYVQLFDEKKAATLYRVNTDGTTVKVLSNEASTNVQFLGRL
jgi:sugar lactone lactonase YvrE